MISDGLGAVCSFGPLLGYAPMVTRFLDEPARAAFHGAVTTIEGGSAVEVVVAVRRQSSAHLLANVVLGVATAFAALAYMLFGEPHFSLSSILIDPFVVGIAVGALVELLPMVKRGLTPPSWRTRTVRRAAKAAFLDRGVHTTTGRSGLLVYASWLEQCCVIVADIGLAGACDPAALQALERHLTATMPRGGAAVAGVLAASAALFARALPRSAADLNELPDDIDAHLGRGEARA